MYFQNRETNLHFKSVYRIATGDAASGNGFIFLAPSSANKINDKLAALNTHSRVQSNLISGLLIVSNLRRDLHSKRDFSLKQPPPHHLTNPPTLVTNEYTLHTWTRMAHCHNCFYFIWSYLIKNSTLLEHWMVTFTNDLNWKKRVTEDLGWQRQKHQRGYQTRDSFTHIELQNRIHTIIIFCASDWHLL